MASQVTIDGALVEAFLNDPEGPLTREMFLVGEIDGGRIVASVRRSAGLEREPVS